MPKRVSQVVMASLEIKVLEPLFAFKVRFWVGVPPPPPLPPVECFFSRLPAKAKEVLSDVSRVCDLNGTAAVPQPNLFGQF